MKSIFTLLFAAFGITNSLPAQVWQQQNPNFPSPHTYVYEVIVPNETAAWAYGFEFDSTGIFTDENFTVSHTSDGGQTWESLDFPHTEPGFVSNISALSADLAWLSYVDYANGQKILKTTDGGQTWAEQPNGLTVWIDFVHFFDNGVGLAVGDPDALGFEIYTSTSGGALWVRTDPADVPPPLPGEYAFSGYFEVSGSKVWFETSEGRVYYSINKGYTWGVFDGPPLEPGTLSTMAADEAGTCYLSYYVPLPSLTTSLYRSPDYGATWEDITPADNTWFLKDIAPVPGTGAIISQWTTGLLSGNNETRLSYDQGMTWLTIEAGTVIQSINFFDDNTGFAAGWQPFTDTTHADVYNYTGSSLTGLFERKPLNVSLLASPNPASDFVNVELESPVESEFLLLLNDANGRLLRKEVIEKTDNWKVSLDLHSLPSGWYTLTVSTTEGVAVQKIVKQ